MVRNYDASRPVDRSLIDSLLELAIRAPSAGFSQGWHFLVLETAEDRDRFWSATTADEEPDTWLSGLMSAPVLIIAMSDKETYLTRYAEQDKGWTDRSERRWPVPYWDIDTGMASLLILLGIVDQGLAGCFFGIPGEQHTAVRESFDIPPRFGLVGVVSVGYGLPDRRSPSLRRGRRTVQQVTSYGRMRLAERAETSSD
jgi:nitroreductase